MSTSNSKVHCIFMQYAVSYAVSLCNKQIVHDHCNPNQKKSLTANSSCHGDFNINLSRVSHFGMRSRLKK